jgi:hypothetical protein
VCGAEWSGFRAEHCKVCHETFTGSRAGDMHRVGDHDIRTGPGRRRCRTTAEMLERKMTRNLQGVWTSGGENPWKASA